MTKKPNKAKHRYCEDCGLPFTIYGVSKKIFCPYCGDMLAITEYVGINKQDAAEQTETAKIRWKPEEIKFLKQCLKKNVPIIQIASLLGRSYHSVRHKVGRVQR